MADALQCPLLLPTDLARLLHDTSSGISGPEGISPAPSSGFLRPELGLSGALLQPGYVVEGDTLAFRVYSALDYVTCYLRSQLLLSSGRVVYWGADLKPKGDVSKAQILTPMPECVIRTLAMTVVSNDKDLPYIPPGLVYGRVDLSRADDSMNLPYATLAAGYLTSAYSPTFPTSPVQEPHEGAGHIASYNAPGNYSALNSGGFDPGPRRRIRPLWALYGLTTDATVKNRYPALFFGNQWGGIMHAIAPVALGASSSAQYVFNLGGAYGGPVGARIQVPLPCCLPYGQRPQIITSTANNCAAGDVIGGYTVTYEEWLEPEWDFE